MQAHHMRIGFAIGSSDVLVLGAAAGCAAGAVLAIAIIAPGCVAVAIRLIPLANRGLTAIPHRSDEAWSIPAAWSEA